MSTFRCTVIAIALTAACRGDDSARPVATAGADAHLLGAFGGRVYWRHGRELGWKDDRLEAPVYLAGPGFDWAKRHNFVADERGIYFSHHNVVLFLGLVQPPLTPEERAFGRHGPPIEHRVWDAPDHPNSVVVEGDCIYTLRTAVGCGEHGDVLALPRAPGASCAGRPAPAKGMQGDVEFRIDDENFYWIDSGCASEWTPRPPMHPGIQAVPRRGGPAFVVAPRDGGQRDLHVGVRGVYWRTDAGIRFAPKAPFGPPSTLVAGEVQQLAVDRGAIFFVRDGGVYWMKEGAKAPALARTASDVREIALDDRYVFALDGAGHVTRSARPR